MCLNAQKAGAKAIVLIHPNYDRDSILLTSGAWTDNIKIPCYTVRRDIGARMSALLPSQVGIKKPDVMDDDARWRIMNNNLCAQASAGACRCIEELLHVNIELLKEVMN